MKDKIKISQNRLTEDGITSLFIDDENACPSGKTGDLLMIYPQFLSWL